MTPDIFSDHAAVRTALDQSTDEIESLISKIEQKIDGAGLDADTADQLGQRSSMTTDELGEAVRTALLGRSAVDSFEKIDEEAAQSLDSGGRSFSGPPGSGPGGQSGTGGGYSGGGPGASPVGGGVDQGAQTNLSSGGSGLDAFDSTQMHQAQAQALQQQAQMQQARESAAWQQAVAQQQNQAMLNQLNIAAQQQAMVQAAQLQEQVAEQNAAAQRAIAEGGAAPTTAGDAEVSAAEIEEIIRELFEDGGNFSEGGSAEIGDYGGSYDPAGLSGLSPEEVSFDKVANPQLSDDQVAEIVNAACDLNGISNDPAVRERFINLWSAMSLHESGHNSNAANGWDSNAHGATQADGFPFNSSRGPWQCIPTTFAAHHIEGTSNSIYDPLASAAASINYTMSRYGIDENGNGLEEFASVRGIDVNTGESHGGYIGY